MSETSPPKPSKLIIVERSRTAVILGLVAVLAYAVIIILAFGVTIARQHTIDTLRDRVDDESEVVLCRAKFNIAILTHDQVAAAAERGLFTSLVRELANPIEARDFTAILDASDRVDVLNAATQADIHALQAYLDAGQPLPCPIDD